MRGLLQGSAGSSRMSSICRSDLPVGGIVQAGSGSVNVATSDHDDANGRTEHRRHSSDIDEWAECGHELTDEAVEAAALL